MGEGKATEELTQIQGDVLPIRQSQNEISVYTGGELSNRNCTGTSVLGKASKYCGKLKTNKKTQHTFLRKEGCLACLSAFQSEGT